MARGEQGLWELSERLQERRQRAFDLRCTVPWVVLRHDFMPPVLKIYIQLLSHVYYC